ncbi:MAG: sigma-70 family RNA polymerase sigma factor [Taibaiella sp.]|nr:sigma-70 family RNA polymerase sigma factor [Taibaiella sp.]
MRVDLSNITDEAYLVKCCKNNEPAAQHFLYNKYVEDMMILCLRYVPDAEDAKEVLMDGFLSFFKNMEQFSYQGAGSVKAWLKKIMVNCCLMNLRKRKMTFAGSGDLVQYEDTATGEDVLDNLAAKDIMKQLQQLPDGYRMVFNLYAFEGLNHREIAELLQITEGTSKSQLHRARAMLKERIGETRVNG